MDISLIYPPSPFLLDEKVMPPLGLLYLSSVLKENGHNVRFIDLAGVKNWKDLVRDSAFDDAV